MMHATRGGLQGRRGSIVKVSQFATRQKHYPLSSRLRINRACKTNDDKRRCGGFFGLKICTHEIVTYFRMTRAESVTTSSKTQASSTE